MDREDCGLHKNKKDDKDNDISLLSYLKRKKVKEKVKSKY
jgi:hypothetical protein